MRPESGQLPLFETEASLRMYGIMIPLPEQVLSDLKDMYRILEKHAEVPFNPEQKAYLPVCSFLLLNHRSDEVFQQLESFIRTVDPFKLRMDGFGADKVQHQLFLKILPSNSYDKLLSQLEEIRREIGIRKNYQSALQPRIPLTGAIEPAIFEKLELSWKRQRYRAVLPVQELAVLNYDFDEKVYRRYSTLPLGNQST